MKSIHLLFKNKKGSITIIIVLAMTALAGFTALVVDLGQAYYEKYRLSNIVDSAALAGAQELTEDNNSAVIKAQEYALLNGAESKELQISTDNTNTVTVQAVRNVPLYFARVLGFDEINVSAQSKAVIGAVGKVRDVIPVGITEQELEFGLQYNLKVGSPPTFGSGNFGALALGGKGASRYRDNLKYGYNGWIEIGDILDTESGNMSGPTRDGVNYRINLENHAPCTPESFERDCPRIVTVPVYKYIGNKNHIKKVEVTGFASFLLEEVEGNGNDSYIKGYFIKTVVPGEMVEGISDYGLRAVKLYN